jgi:uncharacterized protein YprB with RNaseH-like and TPR domain
VSVVVFDIETLGYPLDTFDEQQQEYLLKYADTDEKREAEVQKLSLHALTAQIICIALYNPDTRSGKVYYQADAPRPPRTEGTIEFSTGDERFILTSFWNVIRSYSTFVTFNGRGFDCPFVMLRSGILGIPASRNLVPYRYDSKEHCDLLDQLTFYGAVKKFNLDFFCKAFGIRSPKTGGTTGADLGPLYANKEFKRIADYCMGDVIATAELYRKWESTMAVKH